MPLKVSIQSALQKWYLTVGNHACSCGQLSLSLETWLTWLDQDVNCGLVCKWLFLYRCSLMNDQLNIQRNLYEWKYICSNKNIVPWTSSAYHVQIPRTLTKGCEALQAIILICFPRSLTVLTSISVSCLRRIIAHPIRALLLNPTNLLCNISVFVWNSWERFFEHAMHYTDLW